MNDVADALPYAAPAPRLGRILSNPLPALRSGWWLARGWWYKWTYPLRGIRFEAGRNLRVAGRLQVRGPGRVVFGNDVLVTGRTTPWTYSSDAVIRVGDGTILSGTRFGAMRSIRVGRGCMLSDAQLLDTNFHSLHADRRTNPAAPVRVAPIEIEDNVWIAPHCGLLPGVSIGRNSVVGFGSVCTTEYPADSLLAGNPARVVRPLPS